MHPIVRFYVRNCLIGFVAAAVFVALILWADVGHLWHLVTTSDVGVLAVFLLWFFNGIVFAGVQNGVAIMLLAEREDDGGGGGKAPVIKAVPAPLRSS